VLGEDLVALAYSDLTSVVRGRMVAASDIESRLRTGVGWVPANQSLTPFGTIAEPNPFGSVGDLRLKPDPATRLRIEGWERFTPFELILCDAVTPDGEQWDCCPRGLLRATLRVFEAETGARVRASFEHEFQIVGELRTAPPFSLAAYRAVDPFGPHLFQALREAGAEPEVFLPEFGANQFEVPCAPENGIAAADRSVVIKEVVREVARRLGRGVTFSPLTDVDGVGNGAHLHLSLVDSAGRSLMADPDAPARLSKLAASFAAGILRHSPALAAFTSPSVVSFLRLVPHRWSVGVMCLGNQNRETLLRITPSLTLGGEPAQQCHLELRSVDSTASPHLALAAVLRAGLEGIRNDLPHPPVLSRDPAELTAAELAEYTTVEMPSTLGDALDALDADADARTWLPPRLYETYVGLKRAELNETRDLDPAALCTLYAGVY
jgi:glutamine synthetase